MKAVTPQRQTEAHESGEHNLIQESASTHVVSKVIEEALMPKTLKGVWEVEIGRRKIGHGTKKAVAQSLQIMRARMGAVKAATFNG